MAWSINDLSTVTDKLTSQLDAAIVASPIYASADPHITTSGEMPADARNESTPQLNLYLLHVSRDPYWRNTPTSGLRGLENAFQPLSLNLSYLLTAYAQGDWRSEQRLMSIALAYFHNNPIYTTPSIEWTVTVEADSIEEMSRLWQAITVPIRLSAMFRVAVVFLSPPSPAPGDAARPSEVVLSVGAGLNAPPTPAGESILPHLFGLAIHRVYSIPPNITASTQTQTPPQPLPYRPVIVGGQTVRVRGSGLDLADAAVVYLSDPVSGNEWPVGATWRVVNPPVPPALVAPVPPDELALTMPTAYATPPAAGTALTATPMPGKYLMTVGPAGAGFRSAPPLDVVIAPSVIGTAPSLTGVANPAQLMPDGTGTYTFTCLGLIDGQTSVLLGTTALTEGVLAAGFFTLDVAANSVSFIPMATPPGASGTYVPVRVIVNAIESLPSWWVQLP